tara:strand:- start:1115 stop:1396 length:282 start_codon:yes stop_codon:yes gene_type:complete
MNKNKNISKLINMLSDANKKEKNMLEHIFHLEQYILNLERALDEDELVEEGPLDHFFQQQKEFLEQAPYQEPSQEEPPKLYTQDEIMNPKKGE